MVDITHKSTTLRIATAQAIVKTGGTETIDAIHEDRVPKGNVFAASKATGLLGIKKTSDLLPDCHPLPIEYADITFETEGSLIKILVTVKTIYKTGVEVEAMHGASIVALNIYDMLKPIDKAVEITSIKLLSKKGGKSNNPPNTKGLSAKIVVCSEAVYKGEKTDRSSENIKDILTSFGLTEISITVLRNEADLIQKEVLENSQSLLIFTGGTGVGPKDITPNVVIPLLDTRLAGVEETMRRYGQDRMNFAMLSRSVAGIKNNNVVLCVPGSSNGAIEAMNAVLPGLFHVFHVLKGGGHE